jgi:hypothetical protein
LYPLHPCVDYDCLAVWRFHTIFRHLLKVVLFYVVELFAIILYRQGDIWNIVSSGIFAVILYGESRSPFDVVTFLVPCATE